MEGILINIHIHLCIESRYSLQLKVSLYLLTIHERFLIILILPIAWVSVILAAYVSPKMLQVCYIKGHTSQTQEQTWKRSKSTTQTRKILT